MQDFDLKTNLYHCRQVSIENQNFGLCIGLKNSVSVSV